MVQKLAWIFGIVTLAVGVLGFVPGITTAEGLLLGIFQVDAMHNIVHVLTGIVAIGAAMGSGMYARLYFKVFGGVYALVAVLGFVMAGNVLGMMMNMPDHLLHVAIAAFALYVGFAMKESSAPMAVGTPMSTGSTM